MKKRKLEEVEPEITQLQPTQEASIPLSNIGSRHPTLWFEDGNVILATAETIFRVHSGFISLHSPVLRDQLEELLSSKAPKRLEGQPVLRVDAQGAHLALLLRILYDGGKRYVYDHAENLQ